MNLLSCTNNLWDSVTFNDQWTVCGHKFGIGNCISLSLSLSLIHTHTHTRMVCLFYQI